MPKLTKAKMIGALKQKLSEDYSPLAGYISLFKTLTTPQIQMIHDNTSVFEKTLVYAENNMKFIAIVTADTKPDSVNCALSNRVMRGVSHLQYDEKAANELQAVKKGWAGENEQLTRLLAPENAVSFRELEEISLTPFKQERKNEVQSYEDYYLASEEDEQESESDSQGSENGEIINTWVHFKAEEQLARAKKEVFEAAVDALTAKVAEIEDAQPAAAAPQVVAVSDEEEESEDAGFGFNMFQEDESDKVPFGAAAGGNPDPQQGESALLADLALDN